MWLVNLFSGGLLGKVVDGVSGFFNKPRGGEGNS